MTGPPPNLRYSDSEHDCGDCVMYKPESQTCSGYSDWPVSPDLVCDAWQAKASGQVTEDEQTS